MLITLIAVAFVLLWKLGLSEKVMQHHYRNRGKVGPRYVLDDDGALVDAEELFDSAAAGDRARVSAASAEGGVSGR